MAYLAPDTIGGGRYFAPDEPPAAAVVSYDFAGAFAIAGLLSRDFPAAFSAAGVVGANFPGSYSVSGGSTTPVSADFAGSYSIADSGLVLVDKVIGVTLKSKDLALRPNVSNINWAWSDARGVITSSGGGLSSNASGQVSVPIRTALLSDGVGFLSLDNYTGGNPLDYFGFFGPVRVP